MGTGYYESVFILVGINIIAILGVSLMFAFTGLFTFGHAAYYGVGAYTAALLSVKLHMPFLVSILGGSLAAAVVALAVGYPTLRLRGDYFVVASMGVGEIVVRLIEGLDKITGGSRGFPGIPNKSSVWVVWLIAIASVWLCRNLINSKQGRNSIAILENELAAQSLGINTFAHKVVIFAISAGFTGLAGGLLGHFTTILHPSMFNFLKSTEMIITVIFGGIQSLTGSILAIILVTVLPEFLRVVSEWRMVIYGLAVTLMILLRPHGLMGYKELTLPAKPWLPWWHRSQKG